MTPAVDQVARALAAAEQRAGAAREAHTYACEAADALARAEKIAADALAAADAAVAAARESHETATSAAEKAEASWSASQTAAAWQNVERARSLREQAALRLSSLDASREQGVAALARARRDAVTARAEAATAAEAVARFADELDAASARAAEAAALLSASEAERSAKCSALAAAAAAFPATAALAAAPSLARYARAVEQAHRAEVDALATLAALADEARTTARHGAALGAFDAPPSSLTMSAAASRLLATVANRALSPRGVCASRSSEALAPAMPHGSGTEAERAIIAAALDAFGASPAAPPPAAEVCQ